MASEKKKGFLWLSTYFFFLNVILEKQSLLVWVEQKWDMFCFLLEEWCGTAHLCKIGLSSAARASEALRNLQGNCWLCRPLAWKLGCVLHTKALLIPAWQKYVKEAVTFSNVSVTSSSCSSSLQVLPGAFQKEAADLVCLNNPEAAGTGPPRGCTPHDHLLSLNCTVFFLIPHTSAIRHCLDSQGILSVNITDVYCWTCLVYFLNPSLWHKKTGDYFNPKQKKHILLVDMTMGEVSPSWWNWWIFSASSENHHVE